MTSSGDHRLSAAVWSIWLLPLGGWAFWFLPQTDGGFSCLSNPCFYGICMDDLNTSFTCYCIDGYTGIQCQTNWDECWSSPCLNGATCLDGVAGYNCSCPDGFMGDVCEENFNECASNPCFNNGTCLDGINGYNCTCQPGYSGVFCETDIAVCNATEEARCMNGGVCREGPGVSFNCFCNPGWDGALCERPIDECSSSPCQNGAICVDLHADYACACLFGYTGKNCEMEMHQCDASPCENGALCLVEAGVRVCYCVPDFHGDRCQFQYDECQRGPMYPKAPPRCLNGGTCLDGVDQFTCSCPPDLTGQFCECLIIRPGEVNCTYNRPTSPIPITIAATTQEPITYATTEHSRDIPSSTEILVSYFPSVGDTSFTTEATTLETTSIEVTSSPPFSSTSSSESVSTTTILPEEEKEETTEVTTVSETSESFPITSETTSIFYMNTSEIPETTTMKTTMITTMSSTMTSSKAFETSDTTEMSTEQFLTTQSEPTIDGETEISTNKHITNGLLEQISTTETSTTETSTMETSRTETSTTETSTTETSTTETSTMETLTTETSTTETSAMETSAAETSTTTKKLFTLFDTTSYESTTSFGSEEETHYWETTFKPLEPSSITQNISSEEFTKESTATTIPETKTTSEIASTEGPDIHITFESSTESIVTTSVRYQTTDGREGKQANETHQGQPSSGDDLTTGMFFIEFTKQVTTAETFPEVLTTLRPSSQQPFPEVTTIRPSTDTTSSTESSETILMTEGSLSTEDGYTEIGTEIVFQHTTDMPDCTVTPCLNKGMCVYTKDGPKCICKFGWDGPLCEDHTGIRVAAFTGQSYLTHRLSNATGTRINVTVKTLAPTGLLFCAHLGLHSYMCLFLEDGLLKFQFSCGLQTMLFREVELRVNNGFDLSVQAELELRTADAKSRKCYATLRINNTLAMSGEQMAISTSLERYPMWLHLGGIPPHFTEHSGIADKMSGFTGCMQSLKIDNSLRNIYGDAVDGIEVTECASLACLSNPCFGGATCVEYKDRWNCLCPSGYLGDACEQSVCDNNPCQFGATCVTFPGSGFICLCPLGKHGIICEHDLEIGQPSFSSSVGGLASYAAYVLPGSIHHSMELKFKFLPTTSEQISLMVFVGQEGYHDSRSDHLAVSFIKGYVVLTWNLGSGPRRIFTPRPVVQRSNRPHTVRLGRVGQLAWLMVDNLGNVSGHSPGRLSQLNTRSVIYLGGHESQNFTNLPHDLPLHTGFSGCLFDVELKAGRVSVALQRSSAAMGRSVGQCGTTECHEHACQHGGACLPHGATFTCLCTDGWFGPVCALRFNPCDSTRHNCSSGATCVPTSTGYECDCPLGKVGQYCERDEQLSDLSFSGLRSYISLPPAELQYHQACIDLEVRPLTDRGLILFTNLGSGNSFLSLSLQGGILELRVAPGKHRRRSEPLIIRSRSVLAIGEWHRILAGRYGKKIFLRVDDTSNTGSLLSGEILPTSWTPLYIGGVPDLSDLPTGSVSGPPIPFQGCVRTLSLNWHHLPLDANHILAARNVADCDGTACGGDVCANGGTCSLDNATTPRCACPHQYTGLRCESQLSCMDIKCQNKGRCVKGTGFSSRCHCPLGWGGSFCEEAVSVGSPHFGGDGYLVIDKPLQNIKRQEINLRSKVDINLLLLNFSTAVEDGMILWSAERDEFVGIGVEQGLLKLVWAWQGSPSNMVIVESSQIADGGWHGLVLRLLPNNITLWLDDQEVHSQTNTDYKRSKPFSTDGIFYLGGFPNEQTVEHETSGHFKTGFNGCIRELGWSEDLITDFSLFKGENIGSCDLFQT